MTNIEKAREIAEKNRCCYPEDMACEYYSDEECYTSALEMANWKDQQFKEYLEKKRKEKSLGIPIEEYGMGFKDGIDYILDEIIKELFGEEQV